jgi:hypothetical protein
LATGQGNILAITGGDHRREAGLQPVTALLLKSRKEMEKERISQNRNISPKISQRLRLVKLPAPKRVKRNLLLPTELTFCQELGVHILRGCSIGNLQDRGSRFIENDSNANESYSQSGKSQEN